jgi:import inner membrane translocase subunit TIM50
VEDVRGPLNKFRGTNIPVEFAKWEEDLKEQMRLQWEEEQKSKKGKGGFGMFRVGGQQAEQPPVPIFEAQRQQFQEHFKRTHKAVEEEAAENLKKQKELEEKIKQMRVSVWDILTKVKLVDSVDKIWKNRRVMLKRKKDKRVEGQEAMLVMT